jgi:hypothetical protein
MDYIFTFGEDPEYGFSGWIPKFMPYNNAVTGAGAAHDIFEHGRGDDGTVESELSALGASHYIRGEQGYYQDIGNLLSPEEHLGSPISDMLEILHRRGRAVASPGRTHALDETTEQSFADASTMGLARFEDEYRQQRDESPDYSGLTKAEVHQRIVGWLRKGYRKGQARFKDHDPYSVKQLYQRLTKDIDKLTSHAEDGDELRVKLNLVALSVELKHRPAYELYQ